MVIFKGSLNLVDITACDARGHLTLSIQFRTLFLVFHCFNRNPYDLGHPYEEGQPCDVCPDVCVDGALCGKCLEILVTVTCVLSEFMQIS